MPLIDEEMVESLQQPDGSYRHFHLWLLGAAPLRSYERDVSFVPDADWRDKVICTKISHQTLHTIKQEAKRLKHG
jgi:hypothetical protein